MMQTGRFPEPGQPFDDAPFRRLNYGFAYEWVENAGNLDALLAHLDALRAADPSHCYLSTLDDTAQCSYTSGHAGHDVRLAFDAPDGMDWEDPLQLAAWEQDGLQFRVQQLANPDMVQTWASVCGTLWASPDTVSGLLAANREPDQLLDEVIYIQRLPVSVEDTMIAGQPNGYFGDDWDTFQNHAIIGHLATQWGYRFFGMGAAWMGFVRATPLSSEQAAQLVAELRDLYATDKDEDVLQHPAWPALAQLLTTRRTLLLGYTENMADWADEAA